MNLTTVPTTLYHRLKSDIAFRGGVVSAGATLFALILLSAITGLFLVSALENRVEESLIARHAVSITNTSEFTNEERNIFRRFRRTLPVRDEGIFAWMNSNGEVFSGNAAGLDCREEMYDGWLSLTEETLGNSMPAVSFSEPKHSSVHERFRFLANRRGDNCLVFGRSLFEVDAMYNKVLGLFAWLVPLCLLPAIFIGFRQSTKLRRRLRDLAAAVHNLSSGDLDARMPVQGDDDIDRLALTSNLSFDRLQESVSTLQQLTSVMAHDLRAPLNRVAIPLDEAMRANQSGQTDVASLEAIEDGLADVRAVFDALLRISQIESGRRRANFTDIDLFEVAEGLYEIYEPVIEDDARTLHFEVTGEGNSVVRGDNELIRQAVVNLIENAARYTPEGSVISVGVIRHPDQPVLYVQDNGAGIPEEERPLVLRRLYRYQGSTRGEDGHGLGLSLVKAVIDLHDGVISLDDAKPGLQVRLQFDAAPLVKTSKATGTTVSMQVNQLRPDNSLAPQTTIIARTEH